jgi:hypothetical protein
MRNSRLLFLAITFLLANRTAAAQATGLSVDQVEDNFIAREGVTVDRLRDLHPIVEIYLQNLREDKDLGFVPSSDEYFLGKTYMSTDIGMKSFLEKSEKSSFFSSFKLHKMMESHPGMRFLPNGFVGMSYIDARGFNKQNYKFEYVRREFLGEVRCYVFEVAPQDPKSPGRFLGRIWVEDQDYNIVRFNGIFGPANKPGHWYYHFDSWRLQMGPALWLPAYIYTEETNLKYGAKHNLQFKGQIRFWGYDLKPADHESEFSTVKVDAPAPVRDSSAAAPDTSPVEASRLWDRQAEENVLERLERAGLLAPGSDVDKVMVTVVNNLEATNKLDVEPPVRCRVLLTSTLESFSVGHTIILSRGLLDVLPDEASLASMLAYELGQVLLVSGNDTQYAFSDRMLIPDEDVMQKFRFRRDEHESAAAEQKAIALLKNSPYSGSLATAGLFLRSLDAHAKQLPRLISPHLGNRVLNMKELETAAPALEATRTDQIAALPLGGRVKVDPWTDRIDLLKPKAVTLTSPREKMPFEVTPFWPYLTRQVQGASQSSQVLGAETKSAVPQK